MERKWEQETAYFKENRGNPVNETVTYKPAVHTLKCQLLAAVRSNFMTR